jgi:hypothetical protein
MNDTTTLILPISPNSPYFPLVSGLIGVILGGLITTYIGYLKTKAMMRWETKFNTYNAILGLEKGEPSTTMEGKRRIRLAELLKSLSKNEEIKKIADTLIEDKFENLDARERFIDNSLIPAMDKDLEDTMSFFKWLFSK